MRRQALVWCGAACLIVAGFGFTPTAQAAGNIDFFAGQKELDTDFGEGNDIEEQDAFAVFSDWGKEEWPVHIALDLMSGTRDRDDDDFDVRLDGSTGEIDVGVRWYPTKGSKFLPHLGGGLGLVSGEVEVDPSSSVSNDVSFDDSKLGYWADAGLAWILGDHFKLGGRVRYSKAKLDNPEGDVTEVEAGGLAYGVNAGWSW